MSNIVNYCYKIKMSVAKKGVGDIHLWRLHSWGGDQAQMEADEEGSKLHVYIHTENYSSLTSSGFSSCKEVGVFLYRNSVFWTE